MPHSCVFHARQHCQQTSEYITLLDFLSFVFQLITLHCKCMRRKTKLGRKSQLTSGSNYWKISRIPKIIGRNQYFSLKRQLTLEIVKPLMVLHQDWAIFLFVTAQKPRNLEGLEMPIIRIFHTEEFFFKLPGHLIWHVLKRF